MQGRRNGISLLTCEIKRHRIRPTMSYHIRKAIKGSKGCIFSRGRNRGERAAVTPGIPSISACVGATDEIATGQVIVVDAGRGEVYDAARLLTL